MFTATLAGLVAAQAAAVSSLSASTALSVLRRTALHSEQNNAVTHYFQTIDDDANMKKIIKQHCVVTPFGSISGSYREGVNVGPSDPHGHAASINNLLVEGWQPLGPTMAIPHGSRAALIQTMVLYDEST